MDRNARRIIEKAIGPMLEEFSKEVQAMRGRGEPEQKIWAMLDYCEAINTFPDAEHRAFVMGKLREAAMPPHQGPGTVQ